MVGVRVEVECYENMGYKSVSGSRLLNFNGSRISSFQLKAPCGAERE